MLGAVILDTHSFGVFSRELFMYFARRYAALINVNVKSTCVLIKI